MRMLRRLRSLRPRTRARVIPPFTARAATEVQIIQLSTTFTGAGKRAGAVVAVGLFGVGGALGPAHGEPGNAEGGNVGKIVDGVVEESDGMSEKAADNFSDNQAESGDHGPAEHGGL